MSLFTYLVVSLALLLETKFRSKTFPSSGNTLEGDVSDVIALDQLASPFSPRKATKCRPNFPENTVFQYTFQYTHVSSAGV